MRCSVLPVQRAISAQWMGGNLPLAWGKICPQVRKRRRKQIPVRITGERTPAAVLGSIRMFFLDSELADLQSIYPGQYEDYINRLSAYMASNGKHYANHYATIRKWLDEDSKSKPGKNYDYTETYEEGECL